MSNRSLFTVSKYKASLFYEEQTADILNTICTKFVCLPLNNGHGFPFDGKQFHNHKLCSMEKKILRAQLPTVRSLYLKVYSCSVFASCLLHIMTNHNKLHFDWIF